MVHHKEFRQGYHNLSCCSPMMHGARSCGLGFGVMLILLGTIWLAAEMGWIAPDMFWPAFLLIAGILLLTLTITRDGRSKNNKKTNQGGVL